MNGSTTRPRQEIQTTLDGFMAGDAHQPTKNQPPVPAPLFISHHIFRRNSLFIAAVFSVHSSFLLQKIIQFSKNRSFYSHLIYFLNKDNLIENNNNFNKKGEAEEEEEKTNFGAFFGRPPAHNIVAWRLSPSCSSSDSSIKSGFDDDGEKWAGNKVLKMMEKYSTMDAVIVVSRWFGGTLLGPIRFELIESVSEEACQSQELLTKIRGKRATITQLESEIVRLRGEISKLKAQIKLKEDNLVQRNDSRDRDQGAVIDAMDHPPVHPSSSSLTPDLLSPPPSETHFNLAQLDTQSIQLDKLITSKKKTVSFLLNSFNTHLSTFKKIKNN